MATSPCRTDRASALTSTKQWSSASASPKEEWIVSNTNDAELFAFVKEHLYVAAVSDILDSLDRRGQVMSWRLRPLLPDMKNCGFVGRARTVRWVDIDHVNYEDPYGLEIDMVDSLKPGDVVVHATDWGR